MRSSPERSSASVKRQDSARQIDEPPRREAQLDRARELVRTEEEEGPVDDDDPLGGALDRARADLDVRRSRVATGRRRFPRAAGRAGLELPRRSVPAGS